MDLSRWFRTGARQPSAVLLVAQLLGVLAYPFTGSSGVGRVFLSLFSMLVLLLAVWTVRSTPALSWVAIGIGLPAVVFTVLEGLYPDDQTVILTSSLLHATFYLYTAYALIRYMFHDDRVTRDELWATGAAFTVVAWAFAYIYQAAQTIWPDSFTAAVDADQPRSWFELLYLSFTTLTSTGLSDVVPVRPHARSLVMIEQVAGLMYVALVISRLVGLTLSRSRG